MAFPIVIMFNNSERNKLEKDTETITTLSGVLKEGTSIIDPVILFQGEVQDFRKANYMYIQAFQRYYFINNMRSIRNDLWEISAHVDVLNSFKNQINNCRGIVKRSKNKWNLYLNDGSFKVYQNPKVLAKKFPSGFSTYEFVLAVAGS